MMDTMQREVSDEALITAIRANLCGFFRLLGRSSPEEQLEKGKFSRWHSPLPHPWFNGVLSSGPPEENDEAFIEETIQYFRDKNVREFTWWTEPYLQASDWAPVLSNYGFGFADDVPGMAVELQALDRSMQTAAGLTIRVVADEESLRAWTHVFVLGYGLPSDWTASVYDVSRRLGLELPLRNYIGYWNGIPVSTSCLFLGAGVAGVYSVSTLPEARGKGVGAAMTLKPLEDARQMGYDIGILQASRMGFNLYKRIGFRHLCQIENFYLSLR
jgi:ribosomal protein S18 acetylase RimI-like enzyme